MSVTLRSPDNTTYQFQSFVVSYRTKGGTLLQSRPYAFTTDIISWTFNNITTAQLWQAMAYLYRKAGTKVQIQDEQGRIWFGIILSKIKVEETHTRPCPLWRVTFDFEGDLV